MLFNLTFFRSFSEDEDVLRESQFCGHVVKNGREKYQKNTFGHGLIMLKLSVIERKLQNLEVAMDLKKNALEILIRCIGKEQTFLLLKQQICK